MKTVLKKIFYSLPFQMVLLHMRRYQILLVFWYIIFSAINGTLMRNFGADSLFLAPEYLGTVNWLSAAIVGISAAIFIMSWNITTFILFSRHVKFLAAANKPFLKYCLNNALLPLIFLVFYLIRFIDFEKHKEFLHTLDILWLCFGFVSGMLILLFVSFAYFFGAERTIVRSMATLLNHPEKYLELKSQQNISKKQLLNVKWYIGTNFKLKQARNVSHYNKTFIDSVFRRHHFAAVITILLAFVFLLILGFFMDNKIFQIPAAASIFIFFSVLIAASGALSYWLKSWSIPFVALLILVFDLMLRFNFIDTRNRAFGLNYSNKNERPVYSEKSLYDLSNPTQQQSDKSNMISILENWKKNQTSEKPLLYIINFSGGGNRSACFSMHVLQHLDSLSKGKILNQTFLMNGASGGMLGATYFRALYFEKQKNNSISLQDKTYVNNISKDLLNPLFSNFVTRDLIAPAQRFNVGNNTYYKDRGYAFEHQLNENTQGLLNLQLKDYIKAEQNAEVPLIIFNSTISQDARKMMICTQPISFLMTNPNDNRLTAPDAVDFCALFKKQDVYNLRLLSALRMNATFPFVLPNVRLPSNPVIDVMDAGLRDNYGYETSLRFLLVFEKWIQQNTSGVVLIQIRDHKVDDWNQIKSDGGLSQIATQPLTILEKNWHRLSDYYQNEMITYAAKGFSFPFQRIVFTYQPENTERAAALNFHLTSMEKLELAKAIYSEENQKAFSLFQNTLK